MRNYDRASFRDKAGRVFREDGQIFRELYADGIDRFLYVKNKTIFKNLLKENKIINTTEVGYSSENNLILKHEEVPFITYPYEWSFDQLKDASIFHLELQIKCLEEDISFIDSSAYNIQFNGYDPFLIDTLSLKKYEPGEIWSGHSQFIKEFLNPLIYYSKVGLTYNKFYKGSIYGISNMEIIRQISFFKLINLTIFIHVVLPEIFNKQNNYKKKIKTNKLDKKAYMWMLKSLKKNILKLKIKEKSFWNKYENIRTYNEDEINLKKKIVENFLLRNKPKTLLDFGCNQGEFAFLASKTGVDKIIAIDQDERCINYIHNKCKELKNKKILPLVIDALNPSTSIGWNDEKKSFDERGNFDCSLNLAIIHHLCLANNIPLYDAISHIIKKSKIGIIEFVDKDDETSKIILHNKKKFHDDYAIKNFEKILNDVAITTNKTKINQTRTLYEFKSKN